MPELPDVEIFTSNLNKLFGGKKLIEIKVQNGGKLPDSRPALRKALNGKKLKRIYRSGKEMRFQFSDSCLLGLHLMLTGDVFMFEGKNTHKFTIIEMLFSGNKGLALTDRMRNAYVKLNPQEKGGVDAISRELNYRYMKKALQKRSRIKTILTDQNVIRGIGSSYADEILWEAGISPYSVSSAIPDEKIKELVATIKRVLKTAIRKIDKAYPDKINVEVKEFLKIHSKKKEKSPTGEPILVDTKGMSRTFYTKEQVIFT